MLRLQKSTEIAVRVKGTAIVPLLITSFGVFGILFGIWQTVLPDLEQDLHLSSGALGFAISFGLTASLPIMFIGGRIVDSIGLRTTLISAIIVMGIVFCLLAIVPSYIFLLPLLLVFYAASGIYDVSINAAAITIEQQSGRRILTFMHASFSGGVVIGALLSGTLVSFGVFFRYMYIVVALLLGGLLIWVWREQHLVKEPQKVREHWHWKHVRSLITFTLLLVICISTLASFSEGSLSYFSAIYLRSSLDLSSLLGAFGVAIFNTAMMIGRLGATRIITSVGRKWTLSCAGVVAASGMVLALATSLPIVVLVGFLLVGLSISVIGPVAFSLGGDIAPEHVGTISSITAIFGYCGLLLGPSLIGGIAEFTGLRTSLGSVIIAGIIISILALKVDH